MNHPPQIVPLGKSKLLMLFIASLAFVATGIFFIVSPPRIDTGFGNPMTLFGTSHQ